MKSFFKKFLVPFLLLALVLLGSLCFALRGKQPCANPFPMWLEVPEGMQSERPEYARLKYTGCSFDLSSTEEEQVAIQIECTLAKPVTRWSGSFFILYQNQSNGEDMWHIVFATANVTQLADFLDPAGAKILECIVPRKLFSHTGVYKIGIPERGTCDLPREALWEGADEKCGLSDGCPTESGFPMYQDSRLAGPPEAVSYAELTEVELVSGNLSDILKLSVKMQENTVIDDKSYHIVFCPSKGDRLYIIYRPAECFFYDFSKETNYSELDPGLNTLEFSVPKDLFHQEGTYYLVCALGGFSLFGG